MSFLTNKISQAKKTIKIIRMRTVKKSKLNSKSIIAKSIGLMIKLKLSNAKIKA